MMISVVIPTYNGAGLLKKNLSAVLMTLRPGDELLLVDDASTDSTVSWLQKTYDLQESPPEVKETDCFMGEHEEKTIKVLVNHTNQRFASSCNRGVLSAKGELIVLLNNDVIPQQDFLEPVLEHFQDDRVFAVGCKEVATAEDGQVSGRSALWFARGFFVHRRVENQDGRDTAWAAGGSSVFRRSMWLELGGFDTDFKPAYWEDIDLSYRATKRGWKVEFEPRSVVIHDHETTHEAVFGKERMEIMAYKNSVLFVWKNGTFMQKFLHVCWLGYHLVVTNKRSSGRFAKGYWQAIKQTFASRPRTS